MLIVPNGLCSLPDFPDPGVVSTYVCYGNIAPFPWSKSSSSAPAGFETVYKGWVALMQNGLSTDLPGAGTITAALASGDINGATSYWQNYLDVFGQQTFYSALYAIFTGASGYPIPNGTAWTFDDFDRFGALGLGSGGFGPLYPISFMDIFRLIVNELETTQKFLQPSSTLTNGIRTLAIEFGVTLQNNGRPIQTSTPVSSIEPGAGGFVLNGQYGPFDRIIVATTTRAMELTLGLTNYVYGPGALISPAVAKAIMRTHVGTRSRRASAISGPMIRVPSGASRPMTSCTKSIRWTTRRSARRAPIPRAYASSATCGTTTRLSSRRSRVEFPLVPLTTSSSINICSTGSRRWATRSPPGPTTFNPSMISRTTSYSRSGSHGPISPGLSS